MKKYIIPIIIALAVIASWASYHKGYKKGISKAVETIIERRDTLTLHDTLTTVKPYYIVERIVDSITVKVPVVERDTIMVNLPRTQKVYQDSTYRAVVSGFAPNLDTISVYRKTQYIHTTEVLTKYKDPRWSIGVQAGYGASKAGLSPYIGVGVQYNLINIKGRP